MTGSKLFCVLVLWQCSLLVHCSSGEDWTDWMSWFAEHGGVENLEGREAFGAPEEMGTYEELAPEQEEGRLLSSHSALCGPATSDPVGECVQYGKCVMGGGTADFAGGCAGLFGGTCCRYTAGCNAIINSRVAFWQSPGYPSEARGSTSCVVQIKPRTDTCFIRVQFLDTLLTSSTVDTCAGNTLTIDNMAEGDSSLICGSLDSYETLIRVRRTPLKFNLNLLENIRLNMRIRDDIYRYNIKITQVTCAQINGVGGGVTRRSLGASRSLDWEALENAIEDPTEEDSFLSNSKKLSEFMERLSTTDENNGTETALPAQKHRRKAAHGRISSSFATESRPGGWQQQSRIGSGAVFSQIPPQELTPIGQTESPIGNIKSFIKTFISTGLPLGNGIPNFNDICQANISPEPAELVASDQVRIGVNPDPLVPAPAILTNEAPYFGTVMALNEVGDYSFCGATLIAPTYVLTAASCLLRQGFDSDRYEVRVFFDDAFNNVLPTGVVPRLWDVLWNRPYSYTAKRVVFHPMYDHENFHYDIAVVELANDVAAAITPIALPTAGTTFANTAVTLMGHGVGSLGIVIPAERPFFYSDNAGYYDGTTMTTAACRTSYANAPNYHTLYNEQLIEDEMICVQAVGGPLNYQVCEGDQGGPVVSNFGSRTPVLVGIISGNQHNCVDADTFFFPGLFVGQNEPILGQYPDIAVRITSVLDFINAATTDIQYDFGTPLLPAVPGGGLWAILKTMLAL